MGTKGAITLALDKDGQDWKLQKVKGFVDEVRQELGLSKGK